MGLAEMALCLSLKPTRLSRKPPASVRGGWISFVGGVRMPVVPSGGGGVPSVRPAPAVLRALSRGATASADATGVCGCAAEDKGQTEARCATEAVA